MGKYDTQAGNQCLFSIFVILNFVMFLSGIGVFALGITVFVKEKHSDFYDWGFMITGVVLCLLSLMGCQLKKSPGCMTLYLMILVCVATAMLIISIAFFIGVDSLVEYVVDEYAETFDITVEEA